MWNRTEDGDIVLDGAECCQMERSVCALEMRSCGPKVQCCPIDPGRGRAELLGLLANTNAEVDGGWWVVSGG